MKQPHEDVRGQDRSGNYFLSLDPQAAFHRDLVIALARHLYTAIRVGDPAPVVQRMYRDVTNPQIGDLVVESARGFYDPQGQPGDVEYMVEDIDRRRVARTDGLVFDDRAAYLSTILIANAIVLTGPETDKPFETQLRTADTEESVLTLRHATRPAAERTHEALVKLLRGDSGRAALEDLIQAIGDDGSGQQEALTFRLTGL